MKEKTYSHPLCLHVCRNTCSDNGCNCECGEFHGTMPLEEYREAVSDLNAELAGMENQEFIKALRELKKKIEESQVIAEQASQVTQQIVQDQLNRMIVQQPELYGPSGSKRNWLEREAEKFGLDSDWMPSDEGPYNQNNE